MYGWGDWISDNYDPSSLSVAVGPAVTTQSMISDAMDMQRSIDSLGYPTGGGSTVQHQTGTQWLSANASNLALGVGGFVLLMMFAKAGR